LRRASNRSSRSSNVSKADGTILRRDLFPAVFIAALRRRTDIDQRRRDLQRREDTMDTKNLVQVQIFGHSYAIRGEADQKYILDVAAYVDRKMREITEKLPVASLSKVAILASLNIADELFKERAQREARETSLKDRTEKLNAVLDDLLTDSRTP
jgi:cell division protein ZapA